MNQETSNLTKNLTKMTAVGLVGLLLVGCGKSEHPQRLTRRAKGSKIAKPTKNIEKAPSTAVSLTAEPTQQKLSITEDGGSIDSDEIQAIVQDAFQNSKEIAVPDLGDSTYELTRVLTRINNVTGVETYSALHDHKLAKAGKFGSADDRIFYSNGKLVAHEVAEAAISIKPTLSFAATDSLNDSRIRYSFIVENNVGTYSFDSLADSALDPLSLIASADSLDSEKPIYTGTFDNNQASAVVRTTKDQKKLILAVDMVKSDGSSQHFILVYRQTGPQ